MEHFVGENALLWQKLAVNVLRDTTLEDLQQALNYGVTFLHIRCGLYTIPECTILLERCNEALKTYAEKCRPWNVATGIVCKLSGPIPRVQFATGKAEVRLTEHQILTLTGDTRYENQCFDEVKFVTNFVQLTRVNVGDALSIGDTIKLAVERIVNDFVTCKVTEGGLLRPSTIVTRHHKEDNSKDEEELNVSSCLTELERVTKAGCKYVILPEMNVKTLRNMLESFNSSVTPNRDTQLIVCAENYPRSVAMNDLLQNANAYLTQDIESLKCLNATGSPVWFDLHAEEMPDSIEYADVIIVNFNLLQPIQNHLRCSNRLRQEGKQQPIRNISPDDSALLHCLDFSAKESCASAIIIPPAKGNQKHAIEICSLNPLCSVLVITDSALEADNLLLRKYAIPILEPMVSTIPQQQLIRRAIAYGRRFGYLHAGNCIVSGVHLDSDTDVLEMEMRYVPQMEPE